MPERKIIIYDSLTYCITLGDKLYTDIVRGVNAEINTGVCTG